MISSLAIQTVLSLILFNLLMLFYLSIIIDYQINEDWQQDSSVCDVDYESFDSILRLNRSQKSLEISIQRSLNDLRTLCDCESCHAEFSFTSSHDSIFSNSHNQSTKKINDKLMSVRNEEIYY